MNDYTTLCLYATELKRERNTQRVTNNVTPNNANTRGANVHNMSRGTSARNTGPNTGNGGNTANNEGSRGGGHSKESCVWCIACKYQCLCADPKE